MTVCLHAGLWLQVTASARGRGQFWCRRPRDALRYH